MMGGSKSLKYQKPDTSSENVAQIYHSKLNLSIISGKFADDDPSLISASTHNNEDGELMIETPTLYLEQNLILPICD